MYRKYIENLIEWKDSYNRKPMMVWGARQVGKTYLIKEIFAKDYYSNNYPIWIRNVYFNPSIIPSLKLV